MNKKFTFMVAALLAAGSAFAGNVTTGTDVTEISKAEKAYYYLKVGGTNYVGSEVAEATSGISYTASATIAEEKQDNYLWEVEVNNNEFTLKNKATGYYLAVNTSATTPALVSNKSEYTNGAKLDKTFDLVEGELRYSDNYELGISGSSMILKEEAKASGNTGNTDHSVKLFKVADIPVTVAELQKLGNGFNLAFDGAPSGADVFENLTVVDAGSSAFYLVKGTYDAENPWSSNNTYIVLSTNVGVTGQVAPEGCTYIPVAGDKLVETVTTEVTDVESGKYPRNNAKFSAIQNLNKEGKIALKQTGSNIFKAVDGKWVTATETEYYVSTTGNSGALVVNARHEAENAAWVTPNLGTAVDVKTLVKGQWVVNILASSSQNTTEMKRVLYATEASSSVATLTDADDDVNVIKEGLNAQWIVSADKSGNSVTFKNRITGKEITNVTLFKTPIEGIYSASCEDSQVGTALKSCYIQLRTVENTTQFDGFLKLEADDLKSTEYTLSVTNELNAFEKEEKGLVAISGAIKNEDKDNKDLLTFKLDQSKSKVDNADKLDTLFVKEVVFNYYKDGKLTEAKDTLKAIKYNFVDLKNAGKSGSDAYAEVTDGFALQKSGGTGTEGKFVFRKTGEQYQIMKSDANNDFGYTQTDYVVYHSNAYVTGQSAVAQLFNLNPVAVAPNYEMPENHVALEINGAYLGVKADGNAVMTNDTSLLKSTNVGSSFAFWAFSADKEIAKTPSYYLSSNGKMMYDAKAEVEAIDKELATLSPVFDAEKIAELKEKKAAYFKDGDSTKDRLVKFQQAKYVDAEHIALANDTVEGDALKAYKFNIFDVDGQAVLKNGNGLYVKVLNEAVVLGSADDAAKFDVVAAEAPTSNESVSASEVAVVAHNGSVVVKNAAGKNVVVSTILGQVVANEVLTSDNATINVPAGIVVVAVEGESFKINVR